MVLDARKSLFSPRVIKLHLQGYRHRCDLDLKNFTDTKQMYKSPKTTDQVTVTESPNPGRHPNQMLVTIETTLGESRLNKRSVWFLRVCRWK